MSTYKYNEGTFKQMEVKWLEASETDKAIRENGYHIQQSVGDTNGLSYELFSNQEASLKFCIIFQTASEFCVIFVEDWPDLIELLSKLSVIAIAGAMGEGTTSGGVFRVRKF